MLAGKLVKWSKHLLRWCSIYMEGVTFGVFSSLLCIYIQLKIISLELNAPRGGGLDGDQAKWNQGVFIIQYAGEI